jgi:hypothetical protein
MNPKGRIIIIISAVGLALITFFLVGHFVLNLFGLKGPTTQGGPDPTESLKGSTPNIQSPDPPKSPKSPTTGGEPDPPKLPKGPTPNTQSPDPPKLSETDFYANKQVIVDKIKTALQSKDLVGTKSAVAELDSLVNNYDGKDERDPKFQKGADFNISILLETFRAQIITELQEEAVSKILDGSDAGSKSQPIFTHFKFSPNLDLTKGNILVTEWVKNMKDSFYSYNVTSLEYPHDLVKKIWYFPLDKPEICPNSKISGATPFEIYESLKNCASEVMVKELEEDFASLRAASSDEEKFNAFVAKFEVYMKFLADRGVDKLANRINSFIARKKLPVFVRAVKLAIEKRDLDSIKSEQEKLKEFKTQNNLGPEDHLPFRSTLIALRSSQVKQVMDAMLSDWNEEVIKKSVDQTNDIFKLFDYSNVIVLETLITERKNLALIQYFKDLTDSKSDSDVRRNKKYLNLNVEKLGAITNSPVCPTKVISGKDAELKSGISKCFAEYISNKLGLILWVISQIPDGASKDAWKARQQDLLNRYKRGLKWLNPAVSAEELESQANSMVSAAKPIPPPAQYKDKIKEYEENLQTPIWTEDLFKKSIKLHVELCDNDDGFEYPNCVHPIFKIHEIVYDLMWYSHKYHIEAEINSQYSFINSYYSKYNVGDILITLKKYYFDSITKSEFLKKELRFTIIPIDFYEFKYKALFTTALKNYDFDSFKSIYGKFGDTVNIARWHDRYWHDFDLKKSLNSQVNDFIAEYLTNTKNLDLLEEDPQLKEIEKNLRNLSDIANFLRLKIENPLFEIAKGILSV